MKPPEILSLLEEAAGTRMYEKKKEGALRTLEKKQQRLDQIDEVGTVRVRTRACVCMYVEQAAAETQRKQ